MATTARLLTYEDLLELPDDGKRYEIIDGRLFEMPSPIAKHQEVVFRLTLWIGNFLAATRLGKCYTAPLDVRLTPHNIVQPDLIVVLMHRLGMVASHPVEGAPDLVVEVLSPSTRERDQGDKLLLYARAGVPEYWIADLDATDLRGYSLRHGVFAPLPRDGAILRSVVLPGLEIDVPALFTDLS